MHMDEDEVARIFAQRGVTRTPEGRWERIAGYDGGNALSDGQLRLLNERHPEIDSELKEQWVLDFVTVIEELATRGAAAPWPFMAVFWVRLHGIIAEIRDEQARVFRIVNFDPETHETSQGSALRYAALCFRSIEAVRLELSEDERTYADYRRLVECHPTQESYSIRMGRVNRINERRRVASNDREYTVAELGEAVNRILHRYGNEPAIAVDFAQRLRPSVVGLANVVRNGGIQAVWGCHV